MQHCECSPYHTSLNSQFSNKVSMHLLSLLIGCLQTYAALGYINFLFVFPSELLSIAFYSDCTELTFITNFSKNDKFYKTVIFYSLVSQLPLDCCDLCESHEMLLAPLCPSPLCPGTLAQDFSPK